MNYIISPFSLDKPVKDDDLSDHALQARVVVAFVLVLSFLWATLFYHLYVQREAVIAQTHRDVQSLSSALEEQVERVIVGIDQVMQYIREDFAENRSRFSFETWMRRSTSLKTIAVQVSLFDAAGELLVSREPQRKDLPRVNIIDREYHRVHAVSPDAGLYIDRTVVGRMSGRNVIQLARRLDEADGRFAGVIVVSLDPDYLAAQFRDIDVGARGSVALFGLDGYVRARYPAADGMYDRDATTIGTGRGIFEHLKESPAGTYQVVSAFDAAERIFGYRMVGDLPLAVTVGKSLTEVLRPFEAERRRVVLVGLVASAALLGGLVMLLGELERRRRRDAALRLAETALRENSLRLERTLEAMDQGILMIDPDGDVQVFNQRAAELFDFGADPMSPAPSYREIREHARRVGRWGRPTRDAPTWIIGTEQTSHDVRYERRTDDGRTLDIRSVPTPDGGVVQTFTDITHLKDAEATARAAERTAQDANRNLLLAEQIAQVGHWRVDLASETLTWSDEIYRIHGVDPATFTPSLDAAVEAYHPDDRQEVARKFAIAARDGTNFEHASRIVRSDGSTRDVVSRGLCEFRPSGEVTAVFGTSMDVTNLRRAEREAAQTASLLQATLESMDQGLMVVSADGRVEICNGRASALLDLPPDLMAAKPTVQSVLDHQWGAGEFDAAHEDVRRLMREGGMAVGAHRYTRTRPNGTVLEIRTMPMAGDGFVRTYSDITARRAAEEAMQASEARYRLLAETTSDVITELGLDFKRRYVSPACRQLLGFEPEEMLGHQPSDTMHPDDASAVRTIARQLVSGNVPSGKTTVTYRVRHKHGHWVWVEAGLRLSHDAAGVAAAIICSLRDVSERMSAETARAISEQRYRLLADHSSDLIALRPRAGGPRGYVSPSSLAMLGYEPEELVNLPPAAYVHPDDMPRLDASLLRLAPDAPEVIDTHRIRHKDGQWIWVEAVFRLTDAGTPDEGMIVRARDVTLRHQAEMALAESEARYRLLADNGSDLIILGYGEGGRTYISPAVTPMLGYTIEEAHTIPTQAWIHPDDLETVIATARSLSAEAPTASVLYRLRHKNGRYIWAESALQRVERGGEVTVLSAIRDVTERQRQARHLEQAKIAAEAGARVKAEFLANMSHELRTPLTGILGVHDLLRSDPTLSDRQRHFVGLAEQSGRSLLTIVNDILDFSKIEAGQMPMERVPFSLRELVESCRALAAETNRNGAVELVAIIAPGTPDLLIGDPTRVRQVLLNLTTNALKFTDAGRVSIAAGWMSNRLRIEVIDTGVGIAPQAIRRLFERFSQADGSTTRRFGGTGLGLAICKRLVEMMTGTIGVESTPGEGSTFWVELPLDAAETVRLGEKPAEVAATRSKQARRILVAEDNATNHQIIEAVLTQLGHQVVIVEDGLSVVAAFRSTPFDIVLMDVQMPGQDGLAATREIRAFERSKGRARTPIIALTANAMEDEVERCRNAGMDDHVAKPIAWATLFQTIDRVCTDDAIREVNPVLEDQELDALSAILGPERVSQFLNSFRRETDRFLEQFEKDEATTSELARWAHILVSLAGQLGFSELSLFCAALEEEALHGNGLDLVPELRILVGRARVAAMASRYARVDGMAA